MPTTVLSTEKSINHDNITLQNDLKQHEAWAQKWGMEFNAKTCHILSIRNKTEFFYRLNNEILKHVPNNPHLGVQLSSDLKWHTHINNITKRASSTLGFLRRNLRNCPQDCRRTAYLSLVRSTLEYGSIIWDPHNQADTDRLERIQRQAARFIVGDYRSREPGCITNMLRKLDLPTLQGRRKQQRLFLL